MVETKKISDNKNLWEAIRERLTYWCPEALAKACANDDCEHISGSHPWDSFHERLKEYEELPQGLLITACITRMRKNDTYSVDEYGPLYWIDKDGYYKVRLGSDVEQLLGVSVKS